MEHLPSPQERIEKVKQWLDDHKLLLVMTDKVKIELNVTSDSIKGTVTSFPSQ